MGKITLLNIFNAHVREDAQVLSYAHPGHHMITGDIMRAIANDVALAVKEERLDISDLHVRIDYHKPSAKAQGNQKLKGIIYMANHPLIDCYLDGIDRKCPSCTGLNSWCYVFTDFFYKSYGKQLSMYKNSLLMMLDPERAKEEINEWIEKNKKRFVLDKNGHIAFRTDEAGDITYSLNMWLDIAKQHPEINFYAYTKQFAKINAIPYNINQEIPNFRILLSDSTNNDPNPLTQVREDYGSFAINFKEHSLTPERIFETLRQHGSSCKCPGASFGCFKCTKCSEPENTNTKNIIADEH